MKQRNPKPVSALLRFGALNRTDSLGGLGWGSSRKGEGPHGAVGCKKRKSRAINAQYYNNSLSMVKVVYDANI